MDYNNRIIKIIETREGETTIQVDNKFLHSKYYPIKDAKTLIENNSNIYKDKNCIVIYGLALGYHVKELLNRINGDAKVYMFEADEEIFKMAEKLKLLDDIKLDRRVELFVGYSKSFLSSFYEKLKLVDDILIYNPSVDVLPDTFSELKLVLKNFSIAKMGMEDFSKLAKNNFENNIKLEYKPISEYFKSINIRNKPVIIVSSGPSLDYSISALKNVAGKAKIFSAGSSLKALMDNKIKPDMISIVDANEIIKNQIKGYENLDIPLCFLNTASNDAIGCYRGPKYMFYNQLQNNVNKDIVIDTGKSVATAILDIAIKGGANPIIFVGQDLAYVHNKTHVDAYSQVHKLDVSIPERNNYKKVLGVNGQLLNTNNSLLYFKRWIENKISEHPNITFINCSKGAKIEGTIEMDLEGVLNSIK